MLQQRLPVRTWCKQCKLPAPILRRSYAQTVDSHTAEPLPPPQDLNQSQTQVQLRRYVPRTPSIRHLVRPLNDHIWKGRPVHELTFPKKGHAKGGRNHTGHVVMRHRGGGHKRRIRTVDFHRHEGGKHFVERIEHDPGRSAHIALVKSLETGKRTYILAAEGLRAGDTVESFRGGLPQSLIDEMGGHVDLGLLASKTATRGNCLKLSMIPVGTPIFNIAPNKDDCGKMCRGAGTHGIIIGKGEDALQQELAKVLQDNETIDLESLAPEIIKKFQKAAEYVTVRLSSGEVRLIDKDAVATIGIASNVNFKYRSLAKAGRKRWLGIRPTVRGVAMNAMDHPHGGGRGKSKNNRIPSSPWGIPAKSGYKTRPKNKVNHLVISERPRNHGKRRRGYN